MCCFQSDPTRIPWGHVVIESNKDLCDISVSPCLRELSMEHLSQEKTYPNRSSIVPVKIRRREKHLRRSVYMRESGTSPITLELLVLGISGAHFVVGLFWQPAGVDAAVNIAAAAEVAGAKAGCGRTLSRLGRRFRSCSPCRSG